MGPQAFKVLSNILQRDGDLQDTQCAIVEEQVAKFLHTLFTLCKDPYNVLVFLLFR